MSTSKSNSLFIVFFEKLNQFVSLAFLGVVFLLFETHQLKGYFVLLWLNGVVLIVGGVVLIFPQFAPRILSRLVRSLLIISPRRCSGWLKKINTVLEDNTVKLRMVPGRKSMLIFSNVVLAHSITIVGHYILSRAVGLPIDFVSIAWIRCCTVMIMFLPVTISGLGVRELGYIGFMSLVAIKPEQAIHFSLLLFSFQIANSGIGFLFESVCPDKRHSRS